MLAKVKYRSPVSEFTGAAQGGCSLLGCCARQRAAGGGRVVREGGRDDDLSFGILPGRGKIPNSIRFCKLFSKFRFLSGIFRRRYTDI